MNYLSISVIYVYYWIRIKAYWINIKTYWINIESNRSNFDQRIEIELNWDVLDNTSAPQLPLQVPWVTCRDFLNLFIYLFLDITYNFKKLNKFLSFYWQILKLFWFKKQLLIIFISVCFEMASFTVQLICLVHKMWKKLWKYAHFKFPVFKATSWSYLSDQQCKTQMY